VDEAAAASLARRHPQAYAERLVLQRQASVKQQARWSVAMPVVANCPKVFLEEAVQRLFADFRWKSFRFNLTDDLNALAHALTSPQQELLVLKDQARGQGACGRVVRVRCGWLGARGASAASILQALVSRRSRWGHVRIELRPERRCTLVAPAYVDAELLGVAMGEVRVE